MKENRYVILFSILVLLGISAYLLFPNFQTQEFDQDVVENIMDGVTTTVLNGEKESSNTENNENNITTEKTIVNIPEIPEKIRLEANARIKKNGFESLVREIDQETFQKIDTNNPMRVQRAWEVLRSTGRGLNSWHRATPKPTLDLNRCKALLVDGEVSLMNTRINNRFDQMIEKGVIQEAKNNLATWNPKHPSSKAIGACELIAYLNNEISINQLREQIVIATRQYAKRQRTWFRTKMQSWERYSIK